MWQKLGWLCEYPGCDRMGEFEERVYGHTSGGGWNESTGLGGKNDQRLCTNHFNQMFDWKRRKEVVSADPYRYEEIYPGGHGRPGAQSPEYGYFLKKQYWNPAARQRHRERTISAAGGIEKYEAKKQKEAIEGFGSLIGILTFIAAVVYMDDIFPLLEPFFNDWRRGDATKAEMLYCFCIVPVFSLVARLTSVLAANKFPISGIAQYRLPAEEEE